MSTAQNTNVDPKEMALFTRLADQWWDETGQFATLHKMNPARLGYIRGKICDHFKKDPQSMKPFDELSLVDIGCGGGILSEPLARMGGKVTGIDPNDEAITVAQQHARQSGLDIDYHSITAENLGHDGYKADVVLAIEILEHVHDKSAFIQAASRLVKPGGILIISTINRTPKAWALGIFVSEYILRWVPPGTHHWQNFTRPSELRQICHENGMHMTDISGMVFNPIKNSFDLSKTDFSINYITTATHPPS